MVNLCFLGMFTLFCTWLAISSQAQTFTTLFSFDVTDGSASFPGLVQGFNGNLYGETGNGGAQGHGTVFEITPEGILTTLYNFCSQPGCTDGRLPYGALVQAPNGKFYGTTNLGGTATWGTVFEITSHGELTTLYNFCSQTKCADGATPYAGLVQASNGNFYGTTGGGGANNRGTVFEITPKGILTTLYSFCSQTNCADGGTPYAGLVQASNGNFYGTTASGGVGSYGTVFEITPKGILTTLYNFCSQPGCTDGYAPIGTLVQASNGDFYGTTTLGFDTSVGTVFKITPAGKLTTLYTFCSCTDDGQYPWAGLVQASNGNFYGTTVGGGGFTCVASGFTGCGTLFEITPKGILTTLYRFCLQSGCPDGAYIYAGLTQNTNGKLYGVASSGGGGTAMARFSAWQMGWLDSWRPCPQQARLEQRSSSWETT